MEGKFNQPKRTNKQIKIILKYIYRENADFRETKEEEKKPTIALLRLLVEKKKKKKIPREEKQEGAAGASLAAAIIRKPRVSPRYGWPAACVP